MNWSKCKSIFIVCFLIIDIVLASILLYSNFKDCYLPKKDLNAIETYLSSQKVSIEPNTIPRFTFHMKNRELTNILRIDSPLVEQFFKKSDMVSLENKTYTAGSKKLIASDNRFTYLDEQAFADEEISESNCLALIKKKLKALGFSMRDITASKVTYQNSTYSFTIMKLLAGKPLTPATLTVQITDGGKLTVSGMWFNESSHERYTSFSPRSVRDVLVSFCQDRQKEGKKGITITAISLCYRIDSIDTYHKTFTASGAWKIATKDDVYYYDVRE